MTDYLAMALWQERVDEDEEETELEGLESLGAGAVGREEGETAGLARLSAGGGEALEAGRLEGVDAPVQVGRLGPVGRGSVPYGRAAAGGAGSAPYGGAASGERGSVVRGREAVVGGGAALYGGTVPVGEEMVGGLLGAVRSAERSVRFVERERRSFSVTAPESGGSSAGWSVQALDRAVERDARRYDGGFALY